MFQRVLLREDIPEELDAPNEFYIDDNGILYYYPEENFKTASFTTPLVDDNLVTLTDVNYITFENLIFETSLKHGFTLKNTDHLTFKGCTIRDIYEKAMIGTATNFLFTENEVCYIGNAGLDIDGGDPATLTRSNNIFCNNYFHNWSTRSTMAFAISAGGCGATICHNEVANSDALAPSGRLALCCREP